MLRGTKPGTRPVASTLWSWLGSSHTEFRRPPFPRPPYPRDVTPGPDAGKTGLANESSTIATPSRILRLALWPALTAHGGCRSLQTLRRLLFASRSLAQAPAARPPALIASH